MTEQFKVGTVHLINDYDVEDPIDIIEKIDGPIVDKLYELGFKLEEDMGVVTVSKDGVDIVTYEIYVIKDEAFVDITTLNTQLSVQLVEVIKTSAINSLTI